MGKKKILKNGNKLAAVKTLTAGDIPIANQIDRPS